MQPSCTHWLASTLMFSSVFAVDGILGNRSPSDSERRENLPRAFRIARDLRLERIERGEFFLPANEGHEGDLKRFAVKIAREIEQKDFKQRRRRAYGGTAAVIRHPTKNFAFELGSHRVDAMPQLAAWVRAEVGRRKI